MERSASSTKRKRSNKKRKSQTTRAYRKIEKEVQLLLSQSRREVGGQQSVQELELRGLNFFHSIELNQRMDTQRSVNDDTTNGINSAETYIQIELSNLPLVSPRFYKERHYYDNYLLYTPSDRLHLPLQLIDCEPQQLERLQIRMLNRYQEEAKSRNVKLSPAIIMAVAQSESKLSRFIIDATLYRSSCEREFKSVFFEPELLFQCQGLPAPRCLKLSLKHLRFNSHPQLQEEHRLAQQLEDLYDLYMQYVDNKMCEKLRQELQLSRHVTANLLKASEQYQQQSPQLLEHVSHQLRLTQQLRTRYYAESAAQRMLLHRLLTQWAKLKELRKQQQFQCTHFQISLRLVHPVDLNASCSAWKQHFEDDLAEVYREHLQLYYQRRRVWSSKQLTKPHLKPPRKPNFKEIMDRLKKQYDRAFLDPEEPEVHVQRLPLDELPFNSSLATSERLHKGRNYYLKLYLDNQFVAQTRSYRLEPDLHVHMNETIGVLIDRAPPEQINLWLHEKSLITAHSRRLALISSPLGLTNDGIEQQKLSFESLASSSSLRPKLAGDLYLHINYQATDDANGCELDDIQRLPSALRERLLPEKLKAPTICLETKAIPRSPITKYRKSKTSKPIFAEHELQLCSHEELLENRRLQLLTSRNQQRNLYTKQMRFVPALEHELAELEELQPSTGTSQLLDPGTVWNPIDLHKHRGRKFLQLLYETITNQCVQRAKEIQTPVALLLGDGIEQGMGWTALWRAFCSLFFKPRAPSVREPSWQAHPTHGPSEVQQFNVSLHVVRATGVPARSRHILNVERHEQQSAGSDLSANLFMTQTLMYSNVRPFITLSYGQRLCRSRAAEGSNPTWNEQLQLQITGQPYDMREDIKISLFDELIEQQYTDEASDVYQRVQCNWLGEYRVPISSLLANRKFEGCVELNIPKVLVGYKRPLIDSVTNISVEQYPEFKECVHIWFYLSIEPGCELKPIQVGGLACTELPEFQQFMHERRLEVQQLLPRPQNYVEPLICTSHGKRICLTRLLEAIPLPSSMPDENQLEYVCRFVSLLCPIRNQIDACQSFQGVWLDNQSLLDSTWCSAKDLGVLLCNYLLALGIECWLVLGLSCPYGESTFVLYKHLESNELILLAPTLGKRYQLQDIFCPLVRVFCIAGQQNIYFNIQSETRVSMTNFNIQDSACWLPLFNKRQAAPRGCVQKLDYVYKRSYELSQLQKQIERKIMKKISAWRTTRKTIWNRAFQPRLLKILSELESLSTVWGSRYDEPAYSEELEREYPNFRLYGFTSNFSYTNLAAISERIRTTCIHYNNNALVEFSVAVYINSYANDVISVWVFLLSIVPLVV